MTEKIEQKQKQNCFSRMSKKMLVATCIAGGLIIGAGGATTVALVHDHHDRVEAMVKHEKPADKKDIKIDQQAAIDKFNQKYNGKQLSEVELESDDGKYVYKVKGFDADKEYKVKVNAKDGKVLANKTEKLERGEKEYQLDPAKAISRDEASRAAEKAAKAKQGSSIEWKLEQEKKNQPVWEVKVKDGRTVKEVSLDASSKKVLKVENDH